jgi:hypothetical protein
VVKTRHCTKARNEVVKLLKIWWFLGLSIGRGNSSQVLRRIVEPSGAEELDEDYAQGYRI